MRGPETSGGGYDETTDSTEPSGTTEGGYKKLLIKPGHQVLLVALFAGAAAALLPFATALSGEKAVAAHLIGLVMAAVAAKAIWRSGRGDGLLLTGVGILGVLVPILAWQMPIGAAWILPMLCAVVTGAGCWHTFRGDQERLAVGAAIFMIGPTQAGMSLGDLSRVIQGTIQGNGFLGGGTIILGTTTQGVQGLTTAASIWTAAGIGIVSGLGMEATAVLTTIIVLFVLSVVPLITKNAQKTSSDAYRLRTH